ncbi:MAG: ACT domain-containing protein [Clostridia bacterium]|nr:ACT domain-containing protein [Clostridia bacterium]
MMLKQISVFLENKKGTLAAATNILGNNGIDLIALSIADTTDFGIMRCIVNKPDKAVKLLSENGFAVSTTDVLAVQVPDTPGGLSKVLNLLNESQINVEYLYSFVRTPNDSALILFRVHDNEKCMNVLQDNGITFFSGEEIYSLSE